MLHPNNPLSISLDAMVFDCDGTLTKIEGIDELARYQGVEEKVSQLTAEAMGKSGINPQLYEQRLALVLPTFEQIKTLAQAYFDHRTPDIITVIEAFHRAGKPVYVVSAGLYPAVAEFSKALGITSDRVFAVDIYFDAVGQYRDFERNSPLVYNDGKRSILAALKKKHPRLGFVGDGLNDFAAQDVVTRFVGYGGAYYRPQLQMRCEHYITTPSMLPLLSLCMP